MADPKTLTEQLKLLIENPDAFGADEAQKQELLRLSRQTAAALESPFETLQKLVYSVRTSPSSHLFHMTTSLIVHKAVAPCGHEDMSRSQHLCHTGREPEYRRGQLCHTDHSERAPTRRP